MVFWKWPGLMEPRESATVTGIVAAAVRTDCARAQHSPDTGSDPILSMRRAGAALGRNLSWRFEAS
jgi:hypothetical protein